MGIWEKGFTEFRKITASGGKKIGLAGLSRICGTCEMAAPEETKRFAPGSRTAFSSRREKITNRAGGIRTHDLLVPNEALYSGL